MLLQTAGVLTRPYCIIELVNAIEHGIPIVGVSMGGRSEYRFDEAADLLQNLETRLPGLNPEAGELLHAHTIAAQSRHNHGTISAQSRYNLSYTITARSRHDHGTISAQSRHDLRRRSCCASTTLTCSRRRTS